MGAAGIDAETIERFETKLAASLYKLWNRMSSGSYFPPPVKAEMPISEEVRGVRVLGVPTVTDRIAQTAVKMWLEPRLRNPLFHDDSYGYLSRANRRWRRSPSPDAVAGTKTGWWSSTFEGLFDNLPIIAC